MTRRYCTVLWLAIAPIACEGREGDVLVLPPAAVGDAGPAATGGDDQDDDECEDPRAELARLVTCAALPRDAAGALGFCSSRCGSGGDRGSGSKGRSGRSSSGKSGQGGRSGPSGDGD
jgi:hypothetical protein